MTDIPDSPRQTGSLQPPHPSHPAHTPDPPHPEDRLRELERRVQAIVSALPGLLFVVDDEGVFHEAITAQTELLRVPSGQIIGHRVDEFFPREIADFFLDAIHRTLAGDSLQLIEYSLDLPSGTAWFEGRMVPYPDAIDGRRSVLMIARDISERRGAELRLRQQTEAALRYQTALFDLARRDHSVLAPALEAITEADARTLGLERTSVWQFDRDRGTLDCLDQFTRSTGRHERGSRMTALAWPRYFAALELNPTLATRDAAADPRTAELAAERFAPHGVTSLLEVPVMRQGTLFGIVRHEHAGPPRDWTLEDKTFAHSIAEIVSLSIEASERRAGLETLRETEERFTQLAKHFGEVFWMTDPEKKVLHYINPAYETVWGRSCASLYQNPRSWFDPIHPDDRERVMTATLTKQTTDLYDEEYRIVRPGGEIRWIWERAFPLRDGSGAVHRIAGVAVDLTERRQLEEQFRQAQKMEAVGRLAGGIAHDFNNLLTVINGYTELLLGNSGLHEDVRRHLVEIASAGARASGLTQQLLAFSRRQILQPALLDLNFVVGDMDRLLRRLIGEDIELKTALDPGLAAVKADPGQIEQVILNLAINARDAMPKGGTLTIETANVTLDEEFARENAVAGDYISITVRDTGCGMDQETLGHLFEPFFTTKEVGQGTGLGLATVYGIVKQSRGYILVASDPGAGSSFSIYLPRATETPAAHSSHEGAGDGGSGGSETILLVEDEPQVRAFVAQALMEDGYKVLEATHGSDALRVTEGYQGTIDLLLTDVVMPGMSGTELAREVVARRPSVRVLFMSGYTDDTVVRHGIERTTMHFLQKPFTMNALAEKVREALDSPSLFNLPGMSHLPHIG